jgi:hypothetical protein
MKTNGYRFVTTALLIAALGSSISCMTTYDSYGRPMQTVDPGLAMAGVVAAGMVGYAMADDHRHYYAPRYYAPRGYHHCR